MNEIQLNEPSQQLINKITEDVEKWKEKADKIRLFITKIEFQPKQGCRINLRKMETYDCQWSKTFESGAHIKSRKSLITKGIKEVQEFVFKMSPYDQSEHERGAIIKCQPCDGNRSKKTFTYTYLDESARPAKRRKTS